MPEPEPEPEPEPVPVPVPVPEAGSVPDLEPEHDLGTEEEPHAAASPDELEPALESSSEAEPAVPVAAAPDVASTTPEVDGPLGVEDVLRELFAERRLGSQVERLFRESHRGRRVTGAGTVVRVEGGFDSSGAPCESLLVEPLPGSLPESSGGVLLALRIAPGNSPGAAAGQELSFEGELEGCDALTRRLDVATASVRPL